MKCWVLTTDDTPEGRYTEIWGKNVEGSLALDEPFDNYKEAEDEIAETLDDESLFPEPRLALMYCPSDLSTGVLGGCRWRTHRIIPMYCPIDLASP